MDCLLEVLSAALLIVANIYCSGDPPASLIYFTNINFSKLNTIIILNEKKLNFIFYAYIAYLEIAGSCFLFIFGILLILKVLIFVVLKNGSFILTTNFVKDNSS